MQTLLEIELPRSESFYTKEHLFDAMVDDTACGSFLDNDGEPFSVGGPTLLRPLLPLEKTEHRASLESLSVAALRFFRSDAVAPFAPAEYASILFVTRYQWGLAFQTSSLSSIEHCPGGSAKLHSEALRTHTEQFAYGLAIHYVATLLGIPIDRFFFLTEAGARADFLASMSQQEMIAIGAAHLGALSPQGHVIALEVKARTGWASHRPNSPQGRELLQGLSKKAAAKPDQVFLSVLVSLPGKTPSPKTKTKLIIADPGEPIPLTKAEQVLLLLEESLPLLIRHGLWPTLWSALEWLGKLREFAEHEKDLFRFASQYVDRPQYSTVARNNDNKEYIGRVFSDVVMRLGEVGARHMTRGEAESRLMNDQTGRVWFSGAERSWIDIIQRHDSDALLQYGVRGSSDLDLTAKSALFLDEEPMTDEIRSAVRLELRNALSRW